MNYDRLLQLGGIDRPVPPVPGYISKEELKEWQDDQEKEIPDGQIKGIKEVEDFLQGTSDAVKYADLATLVGNKVCVGMERDANGKIYAQFAVMQEEEENQEP